MLPTASALPKRRGFTLLELLLVVALLTLLAGLLFPVLERARDQARGADCLMRIRQVTVAHRLYGDDWEGVLPHWWQRDDEGEHAPFTFWPALFQPYLRGQESLRCLSARGEPQEPGSGSRIADYALFTWGPDGTGRPESPYWRWAGPPLTVAAIPRPAETFSLADGYTATLWTRGFLLRHRGGTHVGFLDGHARWLPSARLTTLHTEPSGFVRYRHIAADRE